MGIWKDIDEFGGYYQVNENGDVKSISRYLPHYMGGQLKTKERILKATTNKEGYTYVSLSKEGKVRHLFIHRLVAMCFIQNYENKPFINHKNGIRNDNRVENLEWCTTSENLKHSFRKLGRKPSINSKGKFGHLHHNSKRVFQIDPITDAIVKEFECIKQAADYAKVSYGAMSMAVNGKTNICKGFKWKINNE